MSKQEWKAGNMLYPIPAVMVSCTDKDGKSNIITVAWTGTICTNPAMVYISIRPERHSYKIIEETKEFVINLTTKDLARQMDLCGVESGKNIDKFAKTRLTKGKANKINAPLINESPVNIECKVVEIKKLGSHSMFIAKVLCVDVDDKYISKSGKLHLNKTGLIAYSHGEYYSLGELIGDFGYSVRKKKSGKKSFEKKVKSKKK